MPQLSPEQKTELLHKHLGPFIDQFGTAWDELKKEGVDYDSYLYAVWLLFATGVKNLSHHNGHAMAFLQILAQELPGVYLAVVDRGEPDDEAETEQ